MMLARLKRPLPIRTSPLRTKLLNAYGVPSNSDAKLLQAPLYFVRGGWFNGNGSLRDVSSWGWYWPRVSYSSSRAYGLGFSSSDVRLSHSDNYRYHGSSLRCVAIGS